MSAEKNRIVEVSGHRWQVARLSPLDGSYIWQKLMRAVMRAQECQPVQPAVTDDVAAQEELKKATPEERLRTFCGMSFMFISYEDMAFMQRKALGVMSHLELLPGQAQEQPMPVVTGDGRWALPEPDGDALLVTRLTVEALVFNLACFLAESGPPSPQS